MDGGHFHRWRSRVGMPAEPGQKQRKQQKYTVHLSLSLDRHSRQFFTKFLGIAGFEAKCR
jgi:hypothetical protein